MNEIKQKIQDQADGFLNLEKFAIIGVSENKNKFGNYIFKEMLNKYKIIYQIHPSLTFANECRCYDSIGNLPEPVNGLIINVKSHKVIPIIEESRKEGISDFWIQRGSENNEILNYCSENKINAITGKCILMFLEPVGSLHKFHKTIWKIFAKN